MLSSIQKRKHFFISVLFLGALIIWWLLALKFLDPDFGWHLRMGQIILSHGIPPTDPFSYTMPSYPFVDYEWLINIVISLLYPHIREIGLTIIFTLIAYCSLYIQIVFIHKRWAVVPLFLSLGVFSQYLGIRPQIVSWLFFSALLLICFAKPAWHYLRWMLPIFFIIWANLHGGFPLGIFVLALYILVNDVECKHITWVNWLILFCSVGATFLNPYTYRNWGEVLGIIGNPSLHWAIQEWLPAFFTMDYYLLLFLPLSVVLVLYTRQRFSLYEQILYVVLLFFGLSSIRNIPFWILIALPMTTRAIEYFFNDISRIQFAQKRFIASYWIYGAVVLAVFVYQCFASLLSYTKNSTSTYYPERAIIFLTKHPTSGNIYSLYDWGGYLIWKLPQKKVFVDGRMPTWTQKNTPGESSNAFAESDAILSGKEKLSYAMKKYNIDTVLLKTASLHAKKSNSIEIILDKLFHFNQANYPYLLREIKQSGMKEVYKDNVSVIFRK